MSTFKNKNSLRTIEAQIVQKLMNNEARPKFTGSYKKKKSVYASWQLNFEFFMYCKQLLALTNNTSW